MSGFKYPGLPTSGIVDAINPNNEVRLSRLGMHTGGSTYPLSLAVAPVPSRFITSSSRILVASISSTLRDSRLRYGVGIDHVMYSRPPSTGTLPI